MLGRPSKWTIFNKWLINYLITSVLFSKFMSVESFWILCTIFRNLTLILCMANYNLMDTRQQQHMQKNLYNAAYHLRINFSEGVNYVICTVILSYQQKHWTWAKNIFKIAHALPTAVYKVNGYSRWFLSFGHTVSSRYFYDKLNKEIKADGVNLFMLIYHILFKTISSQGVE